MEDALATLIKQRMAELGLSFRKTDAQCDLPTGTMSSIIYGKTRRPSAEVLQAISRGLDIPYRELALAAYGIIGDNPPYPQMRVVTA